VLLSVATPFKPSSCDAHTPPRPRAARARPPLPARPLAPVCGRRAATDPARGRCDGSPRVVDAARGRLFGARGARDGHHLRHVRAVLWRRVDGLVVRGDNRRRQRGRARAAARRVLRACTDALVGGAAARRLKRLLGGLLRVPELPPVPVSVWQLAFICVHRSKVHGHVHTHLQRGVLRAKLFRVLYGYRADRHCDHGHFIRRICRLRSKDLFVYGYAPRLRIIHVRVVRCHVYWLLVLKLPNVHRPRRGMRVWSRWQPCILQHVSRIQK
jgi:hypothetical protein